MTALIAGLALVSVPTFFGTFPEATEWTLLGRVLVSVGWLLLAVLVVLSQIEQSRQVDELVGAPLAQRDEQRELAGLRALRAVLTDQSSPLARIDFRLFMYDQDQKLLLPVFEEVADNSEGWPVGSGATGRAYESGEYVPVTGAAISDGSYGLLPEQRQMYAALTVVAAMPVRNARGKTIAVLTGSSDEQDGPNLLVGDDGKAEHLVLAQICSRLIIDVLNEAGD